MRAFAALASVGVILGSWWTNGSNGTQWTPVAGSDYYAPSGADVAIADGGTGQSSAVAAFDALAPTTTQGDISYHNGTDNVRMAKGAALQVLRVNAGATAPEWSNVIQFARRATSDYTNSTTTPSDITGLSFAVDASSTYSFECQLFSAAAANTTGVRPGFTFPTSVTFRATCQIPASTSALAWFNVTATGASCDATASQGTGVAQIFITGTIETTNAGTLQVQGESEVAASGITIHRGSWCSLQKH